MADIKIDNDEIVVEAFTLKTTGADLVMDYSPRRSNSTQYRRAMVHDFSDGLTFNWANDYPGGITLNGVVKVEELSGTHLKLRHHDLHLDHPARRSSNAGYRRALVHDFSDGLTINWSGDYPGGVTINGAVKCPGTLLVGGQNVITLINNLVTRINQLEARVTALEG